MLRWSWWSLALAVALPAPAPDFESPRLCFEHVGLQGKPMPQFCIVRGDLSGTDASSAPRPTLIVQESTFDEVVRRCSADHFDAASPQAGVYRWKRDRGGTAGGVVGPPTMRWIADALREDAVRRGKAVPEVMVQLRQRLGTG